MPSELGSQPATACVMVVEDDVLTRVAIAEELRSAGYSVVEADGADEAMAYLMTGGQVDLVFSDVQMPGSLDGFQLAHQIYNTYPSLPIILTSGTSQPGTAPGLAMFIPKPYDIGRVVEIIGTMLGIVQAVAESNTALHPDCRKRYLSEAPAGRVPAGMELSCSGGN